MNKTFLLIILMFLSFVSYPQGKYKVTFKQLKEYQGLYEYLNGSTLKIAASPKDTILYAIINESRYYFTPVEKDLFLNMSKDKVYFFRNKQNLIAGYTVGKDSFNLLTTKVTFPKKMWYPRVTNKNSYKKPKKHKDGLSTGNIDDTGLEMSLLNEMIHKIGYGEYPNVHSVLIIKDNKLVFEEYFYEYNKNKLHELRSATKSFISALAGIAIDKGFIKSENETVLSFFTEYAINNLSDDKKKITIEHLLTNQSGLDCDVSNPQFQIVMSNIIKMLD